MCSLAWLHNLRDFQETSEKDTAYNCIAWIFGDTTRWWSPDEDNYWPIKRPVGPLIVQDFIDAFIHAGNFEICDNIDLEPGYEKIAIYANNNRPKHVARQLPNGRWTSKLGRLQDIEHGSVEEVNCALYGDVHTIMKRRT